MCLESNRVCWMIINEMEEKDEMKQEDCTTLNVD